MNIFCRPLKVLLVVIASLGAIAQAQSPTPIIVQAANSAATATSSKPAAIAAEVQSTPEAIKLLEQIKAANDEVLAKQKAALERLEELRDAADQLKIFAKRG
jgi:cell shape-determining protein MreC